MNKILTTAFAVLLASVTTAQVAQVKNTGCPNAAYPTLTWPKLNQNTTLTFPKAPTTHVWVTVLGYQSGNPFLFNKPFTCADKCGLYPATPFLYIITSPAGTKGITVKVPNIKSLWQSSFSIQTASGAPGGCVNLYGALSFAIGR